MAKSILEIRERVKQFMEMLGEQSPDIKNTESYVWFENAIAELNKKVTELCTPKEDDTYPPLDETNLSKLQNLYLDAMDKADKLLSDPSTGEIAKFRRDLVSQVKDLLISDYKVVGPMTPGTNTTLFEALEESRIETVDLTGQELQKVGGNVSVRLPIEYVNEKGETVSGFFTESVSVRSEAEVLNEVNERLKREAKPEYVDAILKASKTLGVTMLSTMYGTNQQPIEGNLAARLSSAIEDDEAAERLAQDPEFMHALRAYGEYAGNAITACKTNEILKLKEGANIDSRNAAMSIVANLMGRPKLIANAKPLKIKIDGRIIEGTIMETAQGKDIKNLGEDDPILHATQEQLDNPEVNKQMADLQILDYICGNMDRHAGNIFYQFDENGRIQGITGIDNDASFPNLPLDNPNRALGENMAPPRELSVISEEAAYKILHLSRDILTISLRRTKLSESEIDFACHRLENIQNRIREGLEYFKDKSDTLLEEGHIHVIKDDKWKEISLKELAVAQEERKKVDLTKELKKHQLAFSPMARLYELDKFAMSSYEQNHKPSDYEKKAVPKGKVVNSEKLSNEAIRKEMRAKLMKNIAKIQKFIPDFKMTPEQIEHTLSDKRIDLYKRAQEDYKRNNGSNNAKVISELKDILPNKNLIGAYGRNYFHVVKTDGSPESKEFNKKMFSGIQRDDEIGEAQRENYSLYCLNRNNIYDFSKVCTGADEEAYYEYALRYREDSGIAMETHNFMTANQLKIKSEKEAKLTKAKGIGELAGGVLRDYVQTNVKTENFLTIPVEFLTLDQLDILSMEKYFTSNPENVAFIINAISKKKFEKTADKYNELNAKLKLLDKESPEYKKIKDEVTFEAFTMDDLEYKIPNKNERIKGGYIPRKDTILEVIGRLDAVQSNEKTEEIDNLKKISDDIKKVLEEAGLNPEAEDVKKISDTCNRFTDAYNKTVKNKELLHHSNPKVAEQMMIMADINKSLVKFISYYELNALIYYQREDNAKLAKSDVYQAMEKGLNELNDLMEPLQEDTVYGEKEPLTEEDIFELRTKMAEVQKLSLDYLEDPKNEIHADMARKINMKMAKQLQALGSAMPGMSLEEAMSKSVMTMLADGQSFEKTGNALSTRLATIVTAPDGSQMKGFFVENRNVAMSDVADMLGLDKLIAKAIPLKIVQNGKEIEGCFMANAKGEDIAHIKQGSHLLELEEGYMDYSPALKDMSDLQVIDYICGNIDRHAGNIFYQFDENHKVIGVTGIDNDMSFGTVDNMWHIVPPEQMKFISKSMSEKVKRMNADNLRYVLGERNISKEGIDAAVERLGKLKEAITSGVVSVMPDEEFATHKMSDFINENRKENIFQVVNDKVREQILNVPKEKRSYEASKPKMTVEPLKKFVGAVASVVQQDRDAIDRLIQNVGEAQRKVWFGSSQFDRVEKNLKLIGEFVKQSEGKQAYSAAQLEKYQTAFKALQEDCNAYLKRKEDQGKLEAGGKDGRRIKAVRDVIKFCKNKIKSLEATLHPEKEMVRMKREADRQQIEAFKADPKMAGQLLKYLNETALADIRITQTQLQAAEQIKTITKFMKESGLGAEDLGISKDDIKNAITVVKLGRVANAAEKKVNVENKEIQKDKGLGAL